eukprot:653053-Rhodomonas_salina.1
MAITFILWTEGSAHFDSVRELIRAGTLEQHPAEHGLCRTPVWGKTNAIDTAADKIANGSLP